MIRLTLALKPPSFDDKVRKPGENALALLAGKPLPHKRPGRPIVATKRVGQAYVQKTIADFAYWQDCLDDLYGAYRGICAYYCFRIEKVNHPQVDHFVAKHDQAPELAYEWKNYRLACAYANTCKNEHLDILDPASIQDGWFQLDIHTLDVRPDPALPDPLRQAIEETIKRLKLREERVLEMRRHAMDHFRYGRAEFGYLEMDHPFLAKELVRQGIRTRAELPPLPSFVVNTVEPEL